MRAMWSRTLIISWMSTLLTSLQRLNLDASSTTSNTSSCVGTLTARYILQLFTCFHQISWLIFFYGCASKAIKMIFLRDIKNNVHLRVPACVRHRMIATKINFNAILHIGFWVFSGEFVSELNRFNHFKISVVFEEIFSEEYALNGFYDLKPTHRRKSSKKLVNFNI